MSLSPLSPRALRGVLAVLLLAASAIPPMAWASSYVLSPDGETLYTIGDKQNTVAAISLKSGLPVKRLDFSKEIPKGSTINGLSMSKAGYVLLAAGNSIRAYDPAKDKLVKVAACPASALASDLTYDPATNHILISTAEGDLVLYSPDRPTLDKVVNRRGPKFRTFAFTPSGELILAGYGDLWMGRLVDGGDPGKPDWALEAYRAVPMAALETQNATSASQGVTALALLGNTLFVHSARLGGSGFGEIMKLAKPPSVAETWTDAPQKYSAQLQAMTKALTGLEKVGDQESAPFLATNLTNDTLVYSVQAPLAPGANPDDERPSSLWRLRPGAAPENLGPVPKEL